MAKGKQRLHQQDHGPGSADYSSDEEVLADALAAHGEAFMSMFDDYDPEREAKRRRRLAAAAEQRRHQDGGGSGSEESDEGEEAEGGSGSGSDEDSGGSGDGGGEAGPGPASIEQLLYSGRKGLGSLKHMAGAAGAGAGKRAPGAGASAPSQRQQQQGGREERLAAQREAEAEAGRRARKAFMSAKASKVFDEDGVVLGGGGAGRDADGVSREEFQKMAREVEMLGATALDKRSLKSWKASMLKRIGASAEKAPHAPAKIFKGMAKAAKERERKALEEAINAGMASRKGRGKKLRAAAAKSRDKGLMEAGGAFKNGVLRADRLKSPGGGSGGGGGMDGGRGGGGLGVRKAGMKGGGKKGGGKKGGGKKGGGKKGGGKRR